MNVSMQKSALDKNLQNEVADILNSTVESNVQRASKTVSQFTKEAEENASTLSNSYLNAWRSMTNISSKNMANLQANTSATLEHMMALFGAKSLTDAAELQAAFLSRQVENLTRQWKEIGELTQKITKESTDPVKSQFEKTMHVQG
jgi:phasin